MRAPWWSPGAGVLIALLLPFFLAQDSYAATTVWPGSSWEEKEPSELGMDEDELKKARDYAWEKGGGSGAIVHRGYIVMKWAGQGKRYDVKSTTKSIGATALGLALKEGLIDLSDRGELYT